MWCLLKAFPSQLLQYHLLPITHSPSFFPSILTEHLMCRHKENTWSCSKPDVPGYSTPMRLQWQDKGGTASNQQDFFYIPSQTVMYIGIDWYSSVFLKLRKMVTYNRKTNKLVATLLLKQSELRLEKNFQTQSISEGNEFTRSQKQR